MAAKAEELLAGSGWLPEPLRTPGRVLPKPVEVAASDTPESPTTATGEETAANGGETAMAEDGEPAEDNPVAVAAHPIAAE
jgi:ParB family chromosome partitioning protein